MQMLMFISLLSTGSLLVTAAVIDSYGAQSSLISTGQEDHHIGHIGGSQIGDSQYKKDDIQSDIHVGVDTRPFGADVIPSQHGNGQHLGVSGAIRDRDGKRRNLNGKGQGIRNGLNSAGQLSDFQVGYGSGVDTRLFGADVIPGQLGNGQQSGISGGWRDRNGKGGQRNGRTQGIRNGQGLKNNREGRRGQGQLNNNRGSKSDGLRRRRGNRRNGAVLNKDNQINNQQSVIQL